ncbi:histidine kinase [Fulvivirga sp. RKSG066]|uniref:sensor histidine kinase n=1 Tax=Fulvivirga aurantia TaxID=2529383 RepID=UPI0012BB8506|nr:sensor histidine kinase [Fulvivirga aurantia]MTI21315.1 histidine kinase [Fulvivirga aurantia]
MSDKVDINDKLVRIIGIQLFGIVIPNATGLVTHEDRSVFYLFATYGYFMLISFLIWQGNRFILFKLEEKYNWFINPTQKVIMILGGNIFYTAPLVIVMLYAWYTFTGAPPSWDVIKLTSIVCVVCVVFITHAYETTFLIKQRASDIVKGEKQDKARIQAQLEALKNQIDPHFMFNSLNSLSYLIDENPEKAKAFTSSLAEVYRYILSNKDQRLVLLEDELLFLNKYLSLLQLRFGHSLDVSFKLKKEIEAKYLIPPISIFMAIENVVKHNEISKKHPMLVQISNVGGLLCIENRLQKKRSLQHSSKIGLKNLDERFKIIVGKGIETWVDRDTFKIQLPMLELNA